MNDDAADTDTYALKSEALPEVAAPDLPYQPPSPKSYRPRIGLIGTGGISASHLDAYRSGGWEVAAIWNRTRSKAGAKAAEFCPNARIEDDWRKMLSDSEIDVVDITLHPEHRTPILIEALKAGKHVLSQKPFVDDLDVGEDLVRLADDMGVRLAVNQNGRWSPHMSWMRHAVMAGLIGDVLSVQVAIHWDHSWTAETPFDEIEDLLLYDFGIHWFDFIVSLIGDRATSVYAAGNHALGQQNRSPLLAQALIRLEGGQANLFLNGATVRGSCDQTYVSGSAGSLASEGPDLGSQSVTLTTADGVARPKIEGQWFNDGFRGAMGELLTAIEEGREPNNSARENLRSLALAFAAVRSRATGREVDVGAARRLES